MYESFYNYLVSAGYKKYTPSGRKGTVYSYCYAIEKVLENEGISWEELKKASSRLLSSMIRVEFMRISATDQTEP
jgi:hypothetical protein